MKRNRFYSCIIIFIESFFSILFCILCTMFIIASIENIVIQNELKAFITSTNFEKVEGNTYYYSVEKEKAESSVHVSEEGIVLGDPGDFFIMPKSMIDYIPFSAEFISVLFGGHAGMVSDDNYLIESMGGSRDVQFVMENYSDLYSSYRSVVGLKVKASASDRKKALDYAKSLVDKKYNYLFLLDTKNKYYCTDLVSRSYGSEAGLNYHLDWNGFAVSTQDLFLSRDTEISYIKINKDDRVYIYYVK